MKWINVNEQLPPEKERVLVSVHYKVPDYSVCKNEESTDCSDLSTTTIVLVGRRYGFNWHVDNMFNTYGNEVCPFSTKEFPIVTRWMPLPK